MPSLLNDRSTIIRKSEPLLQTGESVAHVIRAQEGPNRWIALGVGGVVGLGLGSLSGIPIIGLLGMYLVYTRFFARRILLATDESLVLVAGGRWRYSPRLVLDRMDIDTKIGPLKGVWFRTALNGRKLYIVPRSVREVTAADRDIDEADST